MSVDDRSGKDNPIPKAFKTRRSEIISGLSVAGLIALYGFARGVVSDINGLIEEKNRASEQRIERIESALKDIILLERASRKEDIAELKQRVIWIEREIGTFRKK